MALALNDIVRVKWFYSGYNQEFLFQQTYRVLTADGATGTLASLYAVASYFTGDVAFGGPSPLTIAWLNMLGSGISMYKVTAQKLLPSKTIYVQRESAQNGTGGTGSKATNTCSSFSLVSAVPGRSQISKFHVGPLPDAFMTGGSLSSTALTNLRALGQQAQLIQTMTMVVANDTTLQPCILHRNPNANPRTVDVASYRINFFVRSQRRRTVSIGK